MQQTVHSNAEQLHEATELHDGRDQSFEGLADAIAQIHAL